MAMARKDASFIADAIDKEVRERVRAVVDEEITRAVESATKRIESRIKQSADTMALNILGMYDVAQARDHIVITVKKGPDND